MFSIKFRTIPTILVILITSLFSISLSADCDMFGMLSTYNNEIHELPLNLSGGGSYQGNNDPGDYINAYFLYQATQNDNGYGIIYYKNYDNTIIELPFDNPNSQVFRCQDSDDVGSNSPYWYGINRILNTPNNQAIIVLSHNRQATLSNPDIPDPDPFIWDYEINTNPDIPCYSFEHNGTTYHQQQLNAMISNLYPDWLTEFPYKTEQIGDSTLVDSEAYFHWIIANIKASNYNIILGIHNAVTEMLGWEDDQLNFIFSDGNSLYAYRNYGNSNPSSYYLGYYDGLEEEDINPFRAIRSNFGNGTSDLSNLTELLNHEFICIPRQGEIIGYKSFDDNSHEISDTVSGTWTADQSPYYIIGDITVEDELTIESDVEVFFLTKCDFDIYGQVNLLEDAKFNLSNGSSVTIDGSSSYAELFLDWGSTITGSTPTIYPPGEGEDPIPGDRIIAKNGGIITTGYQNPGDVITISSSSGDLWDGIYIEDPDDDADYWFVNCDISGISKLMIRNTEQTRNTANLNLYITDFHDSRQIVVMDEHNLTIEGEQDNYCYLQGNEGYPLYVYESSVDLDYVWIGGFNEDDEFINDGGIYLYEASRTSSKIENCHFDFNKGEGLKINGISFDEFNNNHIEGNTGFGMLCYFGTTFSYENFNSVSLKNNGLAEFAAFQNAFEMGVGSHSITVEDGIYGTGFDQYLLMNLKWDGVTAVDVSGTNLTSNDLTHLSPSDPNAWTFGGGMSIEKQMLYSASTYMGNEDYDNAEQLLQQLISDYPLTQEAGTAVYYLYHLENFTEQDFPAFIDYLENVDAVLDTPLEEAITKIITKSYMKDKEYLFAIDRLETIIENSPIPDEVIAAMIDEGYCYMQLAEGGNRSLPEHCTVKTATLDEYQAKVNELERQYSFYPDDEELSLTPLASNLISVSNYPNPFNPTTTISFCLNNESTVSVSVYNIKGQKVRKLITEKLSAGEHSIVWNGKDHNDKSVSSGIYFYRISTNKDTAIRKMLLLK